LDLVSVLIHYRIEVCFDFENLFEIIVEAIKKVINLGVSDHDDFCITLNGFWFEGRSGKEVKGVIGLNFDDLVLQCPFQSWPNPCLREGIQGIED